VWAHCLQELSSNDYEEASQSILPFLQAVYLDVGLSESEEEPLSAGLNSSDEQSGIVGIKEMPKTFNKMCQVLLPNS